MNIKIYYYKSNQNDPYNDWDVLVSHGKLNPKTNKLTGPIYPKKADLKKSGYVLLPIPSSYWDKFNIKGKEDLDIIYSILNSGFENPLSTYGMQQWIRDHHTHTSMSIGDVAVINTTMYVCDNSGWKKI